MQRAKARPKPRVVVVPAMITVTATDAGYRQEGDKEELLSRTGLE